MNSRLSIAAAVLALTLLSLFVFPGRTILQSDTQIYIPILERIADPSVLSRDIMASRPHVAFTLYDETALFLHRVTGLSFEHALSAQQFAYRAVGILGLFLLATAAGLPFLLAWTVAAVMSLGAAIMGPAVLVVEYEPVPRGFALPFLIFSLAMAGYGRYVWSAAGAAVALAFHPPTALAYSAVLGCLLVWKRQWHALATLAIGPVLLLLSAAAHPVAPERPALFGQLDPATEALQRMRAAYNWVGMWAGRWMGYYAFLFAVACVAWWRVRRDLPLAVNVFAVAMPVIGMLSIPLSYLLLEQLKWVLVPQFQPGRYLLFVTFFAMLLPAIAGAKAAARGSYAEASAFFLIPLACAATEWDPAKLKSIRLAWVGGLALLLGFAPMYRRRAVIAVAALAPFFVLAYAAGVTNYPRLHTPDLDRLAAWAAENTPKDALFQFADAGKGQEPGVFRVRAVRALYVDWKGGGQVNFLPGFGEEWSKRWQALQKPQPVETYAQLGIDYVVFRAANKQTGYTPVYENAAWVVYELKKASTSLRDGTDASAVEFRLTKAASFIEF